MGRLPAAFLIATVLAVAAFSVPGVCDAGPTPTPPPPPESGFGAAATAYPTTSWTSFTNPGATGHQVTVIVPVPAAGSPPPPARLPTVAFLHGFGSADPVGYREWLEHVARQGVIVVYPSYPALDLPADANRYDAMWVGLTEAVRRLEAGEGPKADTARLGVVGHSYGGGAVASVAARAVARGWGKEALWLEAWAPFYDLDEAAWASLPKHAFLLAVGFDEDEVCSPKIAAGFPARATTIPADRKTALVIRSDAHGSPALHARHATPGTRRGVDALDTRGVWRLDDALRALALSGSKEARARVFSTGPETTDMGAWSDGVPVAPISVGMPPESKSRRGWFEAPVRWPAGGAVERWVRRVWDTDGWSRRPIPSPSEVPTASLPRCERFVATPPAPPWSKPIADALEKGPVLAILSSPRTRREFGADPLRDAESALAPKGVTVLRLTSSEIGAAAGRVDPDVPATALLLAADGSPLLWRCATEPHFLAAALSLLP